MGYLGEKLMGHGIFGGERLTGYGISEGNEWDVGYLGRANDMFDIKMR